MPIKITVLPLFQSIYNTHEKWNESCTLGVSSWWELRNTPRTTRVYGKRESGYRVLPDRIFLIFAWSPKRNLPIVKKNNIKKAYRISSSYEHQFLWNIGQNIKFDLIFCARFWKCPKHILRKITFFIFND